MTTGLEGLDARTLAQCTRNLKDNLERAVSAPLESLHDIRPGARSAPADVFHVSHAILTMYEREIRARGMDPSHPVFGRDWSTFIAESLRD